jgi:hypothetical protein
MLAAPLRPSPMNRAVTRQHAELRWAGDRHQRCETTDELRESPQVLHRCSEQYLIFGALRPRHRRRSSLRMHFMCANLISIFFRSRRDC